MSEYIYDFLRIKEIDGDTILTPNDNVVVLYNDGDLLYAKKDDGTSVCLETSGLTSDYYLKTETYSQAQASANFLSADTSYYTTVAADANFLSASTSYYTQAQVDANFLSGTTTSFQMIDQYTLSAVNITVSAGTFVIS